MMSRLSRAAHLVIMFLGLLRLRECAAQSCVTIDIENNTLSTAIIPEDYCIYITAGLGLVNVTLSSNDSIELDSVSVSCEEGRCTVVFVTDLDVDGEGTVNLTVLTTLDTYQSLLLTIRENLAATCASYSIPKSFTEDTAEFVFVCEPPMDVGTVEVIWRKFRLKENLRGFLINNGSYNDSIITTDDVFTVADNTYTLTVDNSAASNYSFVAFYYVPSFMMSDGTELITAETLVFVGPILEDQEEFSKDTTFEIDSYDEIKCETETFPPSSVSWVLVNEENQEGVDVADLVQFELLDTGSAEELTLTFDAMIQMRNLQYEDDGTFTCVASNGYHSDSRWFRLRVKSRLRPLWPALGIIGVAILVPALMLFQFTVEKVQERKSKDYKSGPSPDGNQRVSVSSTDGHSDNNDRGKHNAVKRLSSNKPLIDESTL